MPDDATLIEFLDDDLREEFDKYKHGAGSGVMRELILAKQRKRQRDRLPHDPVLPSSAPSSAFACAIRCRTCAGAVPPWLIRLATEASTVSTE